LCCAAHDICGKQLNVNDVIVFRGEAIPTEDGELEYVVKAYLVRAGSQLCHVGFLPRRLLKMRAQYENKLASVVEDLRASENSQKRRRSERNRGIVRCLLLSAIEEHFRS
jgi:hypothetical protein